MMPDCLFQITLSKDHPIKQNNLVNIVNNMPSTLKTIKLYFVVPEEHFDYRCHPNSKSRFPNPKLFCASQIRMLAEIVFEKINFSKQFWIHNIFHIKDHQKTT